MHTATGLPRKQGYDCRRGGDSGLFLPPGRVAAFITRACSFLFPIAASCRDQELNGYSNPGSPASSGPRGGLRTRGRTVGYGTPLDVGRSPSSPTQTRSPLGQSGRQDDRVPQLCAPTRASDDASFSSRCQICAPPPPSQLAILTSISWEEIAGKWWKDGGPLVLDPDFSGSDGTGRVAMASAFDRRLTGVHLLLQELKTKTVRMYDRVRQTLRTTQTALRPTRRPYPYALYPNMAACIWLADSQHRTL